jgi:UDP-glucuronate 4-epimerase
MHKIYITGIAGFIGFHTAEKLAMEGYEVSGIDNFNDYYDSQLKRDRALLLKTKFNIPIYEANIEIVNWNKIWKDINWESLGDYDAVIHLAAHAGVRHSLENPQMYINTNISATQRLIQACEEHELPVIYASSSCVLQEHSNSYAWSKYVNECQFAYSKLLSAGLRFFTVYGEYNRPDMALSLFANNISQGKEINVYNNGDMQRDFTYVGDIVQGIQVVLENILNQPQENMHEIYNLGSGKSNELMDYIECLENELGRVGLKNYLPMHPADAKSTLADITKIQKLGYQPTTTIEDGIKYFVDWFKEYYKDMYFK